MRILYFGNNWLGWQILRWLRDQQEEIVGLVLHPQTRRSYGDRMISTAGIDQRAILDGSRLKTPTGLEAVRTLRPDLGISVLFDHILQPDMLDIFPLGCLNLHPALLPHNRGQYPNVWSIVDGSPAGTTLHFMDNGIDTGDIVAQRSIPVESYDTGETLYRRLEAASLELFKQSWPIVRNGQATRTPQRGAASYHRTQDVDSIDLIDLDATTTARKLIDRLRARTFPPHPGAYFVENGRRIYLRLYLAESQELGHNQPGPIKERED